MSKKDLGFLEELIESTGTEFLDTGELSEDVPTDYIDTGSYILNALFSGSLFGGIPSNRIVSFTGHPQTGKTFFTLSACKSFLEKEATNIVIYIETEGALQPDDKDTDKLLTSFGIDRKRFRIVPVETVQEFRTYVLRMLQKYNEKEEKDRPKLLICVDSLGNLGTNKETEDALAAKDVSDMTRARLIKAAFRMLTMKMSKNRIPLIATNHVYTQIGSMFPQDIPSGGSGYLYLCSIIVALSRKKEKDGDEIVGNIIHCKNFKNRLAKENKIVDVLLRYDTGLNRYYGLVDLAVEAGIFKKLSTRIELPDGSKIFESRINKDPEKYFTEDILKQLDEYAKKAFAYGSVIVKGDLENEKEESEE